jgi:hypothetical protein
MNHDTRIRENSGLLEKIATAYPEKSPELQALKMSALAFSYVVLHHEKEFDKFVQNLHKPLTKRDRLRLEKLNKPHLRGRPTKNL